MCMYRPPTVVFIFDNSILMYRKSLHGFKERKSHIKGNKIQRRLFSCATV